VNKLPKEHLIYAGANLYCLATEARAYEHLAQGCTRKHTGRESNPRPSDRFVKKKHWGGVADRQEGGGAAM